MEMDGLDRSYRICVLMGGSSSEREVSLQTGEGIYNVLKGTRHDPFRAVIDGPEDLIGALTGAQIVFNGLHGGIGEDGTLQILLETLRLPYTGTGPLGSALGMNKLLSKKTFRENSLPVPNYLKVREGVSWREEAEKVGFPLVAKPVSGGSSLGIEIISGRSELDVFVEEKLKETKEDYFLEEYVPGRELTVGVLEIEGDPQALPPIELRVEGEPFFNYKAKYTPGPTNFIVPAELSEELEGKVKEMALEAHVSMRCHGYSRVDFRLAPDGGLYLLELNTLPGMTEMSDLPRAAKCQGISYGELVGIMLSSAAERVDRFRNRPEGW